MNRALPLVVLVTFVGCTTGVPTGHSICESNDDCPDGQLCFAEGCGDPGNGIAVEVSGGSLTTHPVQDFAIVDGSLSKAQDFDLATPPGINGEFQRERAAIPDPTDRVSYTGAVALRAVGKSVLLPGITRTIEARFESPERGFFEMKLPSGEYVLTAQADDRTVPPVTTPSAVQPGRVPTSVNLVFPAGDGAPALTGQLIKTTDSTLLPPEPVLLSTGFAPGAVPVVDVQLFDVETNQPLSQRFPISGTTGEFSLTVSPEARNKAQLVLVASPRDTGVPIPTKRFLLATPLPPAVSLEYGDFGEVGAIGGLVVDANGAPVPEAQVLLEGTVGGDGTFRSKVAITDNDGRYTLNTLPSRGDGSFRLYVVPPRKSRASATRVSATVTVTDGVARVTPETVKLPTRLIARGRVLRAGSDVGASGVAVRVTAQETSTNPGETTPLPLEPAETMTGADGTFELPLDEGLWRFEYFPSDQSPLASRLVNVQAALGPDNMPLPELQLRDVPLSFGRTVTGVVTATTGGRSAAAPYARIRFFRVAPVEGKQTSILLGTAVANERGAYRVVLPAVSAGTQGE